MQAKTHSPPTWYCTYHIHIYIHIFCQIIVSIRRKAAVSVPWLKYIVAITPIRISRRNLTVFQSLLRDLHPYRKLLKRLLRNQRLFFLRQTL